MKCKPIFFFILSCCFANGAFATIINFDNLAGGTTVTNQYAGLGVTFSGTNSPITSDSFTGSYGSLASDTILLSGGGSPSIINLIFSSVVGYVSADIIFRDTGEVASLQVFNAAMASLGSWTTLADTGPGDEVTLLGTVAGIAFATLTFDATDTVVGIDNLGFTDISVPEPSVLVLLAFGLAALRVRKNIKIV